MYDIGIGHKWYRAISTADTWVSTKPPEDKVKMQSQSQETQVWTLHVPVTDFAYSM